MIFLFSFTLAITSSVMEGAFNFFSLFCLFLLLLPYPISSLPLCTDLGAPFSAQKPLAFCPYSGNVCCDSAKDLQLQKQYEAMNISDTACASTVKSILCATCDPFSAELFRAGTRARPVPVLCNSTGSADSLVSKQATISYCSAVWDTCQDISIKNSPFAPSLQGAGTSQNSTSSTLTDLWQSKSDFCDSFGGASADDSLCFQGKPISLNKSETLPAPKGMCLEKVGNGAYLNMVAHPDGSNRAFFSNQPGKIWLAKIPEQGSGESLELDESSPFVDLTDQIHFDTSFGMMGMAFHPNFAQNGRFFASFNCDKVSNPGCSARCACNSDVGCDPSKLPSSSATDAPCQYHMVVAEYSANGTASEPSQAETAKPTEVRRIFTIGLPSSSSHGGQVLFSPADKYMYIMTGDGGLKGEGHNFAQNKNSLLGKVMRIDVDNFPSEGNTDLWGNYSIPRDNPYSKDKEAQPEIWAEGLRNPWRCSFDVERPSYFVCADTGQDQYEEVDIITKGGNYGWPAYEGPLLYDSKQSDTKNNTVDITNPIFPVVGYSHSDVNKKEGSAAISGGYFYRSTTDPCMYGSYVYADLYAGNVWAAAETPKNSGNFSATSIPFSCAKDSPMNCSTVPNSRLAALGYIFSFGEDNNKDIYILTSTGVYRIVQPSRCDFTCSKEVKTSASPNTPPSSSNGHHITIPFLFSKVSLISILVLVAFSL